MLDIVHVLKVNQLMVKIAHTFFTMKDAQTTIKLKDAIAQMRALTKINVPFSFSFISYSSSLNKSEGLKVVDKALLRKSYREDTSVFHNILIAYTDYTNKEADRQFYLPLLMTFNNMQITP